MLILAEFDNTVLTFVKRENPRLFLGHFELLKLQKLIGQERKELRNLPN